MHFFLIFFYFFDLALKSYSYYWKQLNHCGCLLFLILENISRKHLFRFWPCPNYIYLKFTEGLIESEPHLYRMYFILLSAVDIMCVAEKLTSDRFTINFLSVSNILCVTKEKVCIWFCHIGSTIITHRASNRQITERR